MSTDKEIMEALLAGKKVRCRLGIRLRLDDEGMLESCVEGEDLEWTKRTNILCEKTGPWSAVKAFRDSPKYRYEVVE